ncbi:uncharacterized protein DC041_0000863 [Schistosoma bovis]|uniref:Yippee domain-containing protein n=1 Tax=Schistosoma bovis TaxID=6184 RepID=A0A430Q2Y2_SCHBO|nr:uncharacterized protein DC041_0000863 [Schistosoma bovis]
MVKGKFQAYFPFEKNSLTYSCLHCRAHLARHDDLISKSFQGSQGRAYLFNQAVNVRCAEAKQRVLLTGLHFVADIFCACCDTALGWKYERAFEPSQRYKEGKVIIELAHLFKDNSWDAEWLYPLYPTSSIANGNTSDTTLKYAKPHSISVSDYRRSETGKPKSSLNFPPIDASDSLSSTDGGVFESSTTDLIDPNEETCTDFVHHHHHSHPPPSLHHHHHQLHYHLNTSPSSTQVHQSSFSLMSNDPTSLSYRLSSSLNATGWAFRIPPSLTSNNDSHDKYLLDLSDSGRVSDYCHTCTSTSATEDVGHLNLVCSTDNNISDSDIRHVDNLTPDNVIITNIDKSNTRIHNNTDNKTRIVSGQTGTNINNNNDTSNNNAVDNNNNNSDYSCLETDAYDIFEDINFNNGNNHRPVDDLCLRKLSQFSTPQARRISKINTQNLRVTFNSNLAKRNRKRIKHRLRASSASPSRDFLLPTGSEDEEDDKEKEEAEAEETDNLSDFTNFHNQSQNIVKYKIE